MNITKAKKNSTYSSEMNVPRSVKIPKSVYRFSTLLGPRLCVGADGTPIQISGLKCALQLANPPKISMLE
jgi:hypothetical protein